MGLISYPFIFISLLFIAIQKCASFMWIPDDIRIHIPSQNKQNHIPRHLNKNSTVHAQTIVSITSNGPIYQNDGGHFRIVANLTTNNAFSVHGQSSCINFDANTESVEFLVMSANLFGNPYETRLSYFFDVNVVKYKHTFNAHNMNYLNITYKINFANVNGIKALTDLKITTQGCARPRTWGKWNDNNRWMSKAVPPSATSPQYPVSIVFPAGTGVVQLSNDVAVSSLEVLGGLLLAYTSSCPDGWSTKNSGTTSAKCYKLYENISSYDEAENTCMNDGFGSMDAHLVQISDYEELTTVKGLCRSTHPSSAVLSPAAEHGCWIGLRDRTATGDFEWLQPLFTGGNSFRDFRRGEPNNHTFSEGVSTSGELCVALLPWEEDPLIQEQGSWDDVGCVIKKAYVCQIYGVTKRFSIHVTGSAHLMGGGLEGGMINSNGFATIRNFFVRRSGSLQLLNPSTSSQLQSSSPSLSSWLIGDLLLMDGAVMRVESHLIVNASLVVGEAAPSQAVVSTNLPQGASAGIGVTPRFVLGATGSLTIEAHCGRTHTSTSSTSSSGNACTGVNVTLDAAFEGLGTVHVADRSHLELSKQVDLAVARVHLGGPHARLTLGGSSRLSTYDSFDLRLAHRGPVIAEYPPTPSGQLQGVYRLVVTEGALGSSVNIPSLVSTFQKAFVPSNEPWVPMEGVEVTRCIPYPASAGDMASYLSPLSIIESHGGVTVRRYGNSSDSNFNFGYTYRIEMDAPDTEVFALGPVSINVLCTGAVHCNCPQTVVPLADASGQVACPRNGSYSSVSPIDPTACVLTPSLSVSRVTALSFTNFTGSGTLTILGGTHRLPPVLSVPLVVMGGSAIVSANLIDWLSVSAVHLGRFVAAGKGWIGWDSADVLFGPQWTDERGLVKELNSAPGFNMFAEYVAVQGQGSLLTVCPHSNLTMGSGLWAGGVIGGRSQITVVDSLYCTETNKALRYGVTLFIEKTAHVAWDSGNISLADGAQIIVEGNWLINATTELAIGQAQLLLVPNGDTIAYNLLSRQSQRQWHGYFDDTISDELRQGWYINPLCGDVCLKTNVVLFRGNANLTTSSQSRIYAFAPLNFLGFSNAYLGKDSYFNIVTGGVCGNKVVMNIANGTTLELSGENMVMKATCTITGQGELLISGGAHDLANSIQSHITIENGSMVWPVTRGPGGSIKFYGGLLLRNVGLLQVQTFSTTVSIYQTVELRDNSTIQFPDIGTAAQPSVFDRFDAPDPSPRGTFEIREGKMFFNGGTLRGKADFVAYVQLYLGGADKYIRSLAKLINKGHCEWSTGSITMSDGANFVNEGTVQMSAGAAMFQADALIEGTIVPVQNGGDPFALDFHGWDEDYGGLNYNEYLHLRTIFVSHTPPGYREEEQPGYVPFQLPKH